MDQPLPLQPLPLSRKVATMYPVICYLIGSPSGLLASYWARDFLGGRKISEAGVTEGANCFSEDNLESRPACPASWAKQETLVFISALSVIAEIKINIESEQSRDKDKDRVRAEQR